MPKITIYSTASCGYCKMLKGYLQSKDIQFEEKRADEDQKIAQELYEKSHQLGVPFSIIEKDDGSQVGILGFDKQRFDQELAIA
jgi:glutaredoxin